MKSEKRPDEMKLEEALERLEAIAREMEDDTVDLAGSLKRYKEARSIYTHCVSQLTDAEREVQILMADGGSAALESADVDREESK